MTTKKLIGSIHLWLGLISGPLVFIIALTGCLYAFQEEIQNATQPYRYVAQQAAPLLPPSSLQQIAEQALPGKEVHSVTYMGTGRAARASYYSEKDSYFYLAYINPYTGKVLQVRDENSGFFRFVLNGHYYLWLPPAIGQPVVACATLVFFTMVISGLFLWWPRNKQARKQRFSVKLSAKWRRLNYDLHQVPGFYVAAVALIFAITGLVWGFQWFSKAYYVTISGGQSMADYKEPTSVWKGAPVQGGSAVDQLWYRFRDSVTATGTLEVHIPHDTASSVAVNINPDATTYWKTDYRYFDQYSLQEMSVGHIWGRFPGTTRAQKLLRMNYDIHVGAILGLPGKIMACGVSLIIASLPITGFLIWWGRRKKQPKAAAGRVVVA